jgi:mannose-6-phosphate isomerase-like protein (cupin superfamily)
MSFDPSRIYVYLGADGSSMQLPGGEAFWSQDQSEIERYGKGWLVSEFECSADWSNWEMHPNADEFVYLLSGAATLLLEFEDGIRNVPLNGRAAVVVPKGTWHTAKVSAPSRLLFITLGTGTQHRPVQPHDA